MTSSTETLAPSSRNVFLTLLPIALAVFIGYLTIGLPLSVLPLHLHDTLGMNAFVVGIVLGSQFAAALLSRASAGRLADMRGSKRAVVLGGIFAACSGIAYLASLIFITVPVISIAILLAGRILLGYAESLIATGAISWGVALVGRHNAGKVMAWVGVAIYGAYAGGAPLGMAIYAQAGFAGIAGATALIPLLALATVATLPAVPPMAQRPVPFYKVLGAVWLPGLGLSLSSVGFGTITSFMTLLFAAKGWSNASLAFTVFGLAFISARLFFSHMPDRLGGAKVALASVLVETVGQFLIYGATDPVMAYAGTALTGFGYSLAFPGFGVEAVRRAPPEARGVAMGAYVAFLDISMGATAPLAGAVATWWTLGSVYLIGAIAVASATVVAVRLLRDR